MSKIIVKEREHVTPGEVLAEGMDLIPSEGTYRNGEQIISSIVGLVNLKNNAIQVNGFKSVYMPRRGDYVIGTVTDMNFSSWFIDVNCPYDASLPVREASREFIDLEKNDMTYYYTYGDVIFAKIIGLTKSKIVTLTMKEQETKKLNGGIIMKINSSKIPRLIGTKGSMISMIKDKTKTQIIIGQNGIVWIKGEPVDTLKAKNIIEKISNESHTSGLTEKIEKMLNKGE
ncbi:Exosome complex component Rrp4 [Candidatus Tiddalikarchaeum anstoanum]|nr:Exosome complex component Rrp4 [Candidatus Tiddalikarchaeum anstoanum]